MDKAVASNAIKLGLFALLTAGILAYTNLGTKDRIVEQIRIAKEKALLEIVPDNRHDNEMLDDNFVIPDADKERLHLKKLNRAFVARKDGKPVAVIFPATAPDGYSGPIKMLVGINVDGTIAGVRVVDHNETPGLGDGISLKKSDWILSFNGKSLESPLPEQWKVKKDKGVFDQFTGATITPRAVVTQVHQTLVYFEDSKALIFPELYQVPTVNTDAPETAQQR